jgi:spermidine dehydrogenase
LVKTPIIFTNVALRNWLPWKKLGVGVLVNPGSYHVLSMLDYPVDLGGQRYPATPTNLFSFTWNVFPTDRTPE